MSAMIRILPRQARLASTLPRASRSLTTFSARPLALQTTSSPRRLYATETAIPPSANDLFANGANAYYAEE